EPAAERIDNARMSPRAARSASPDAAAVINAGAEDAVKSWASCARCSLQSPRARQRAVAICCRSTELVVRLDSTWISASCVTASDAVRAPLWACTGLAHNMSNGTAHATAWSRMLRRRRVTASADDGVLLEKRIGLGLRKPCFRGGRLRAVPIQL